jgi:hypothetical protein
MTTNPPSGDDADAVYKRHVEAMLKRNAAPQPAAEPAPAAPTAPAESAVDPNMWKRKAISAVLSERAQADQERERAAREKKAKKAKKEKEKPSAVYYDYKTGLTSNLKSRDGVQRLEKWVEKK